MSKLNSARLEPFFLLSGGEGPLLQGQKEKGIDSARNRLKSRKRDPFRSFFQFKFGDYATDLAICQGGGKSVNMYNLSFFLYGAIGAFTKDILKDNKIELPKKFNGHLVLGFLGGIITGGMAGIFVNNDPATAFLAGYAGTSVIESLLRKKEIVANPGPETIEELIRRIAKEKGVDPDLAVRVAKCESSLNPKARNINAPNSVDRGLFQINSYWHPHITDEMADDPELATLFFCKAVKDGNLSWWNASRKCWDK